MSQQPIALPTLDNHLEGGEKRKEENGQEKGHDKKMHHRQKKTSVYLDIDFPLPIVFNKFHRALSPRRLRSVLRLLRFFSESRVANGFGFGASLRLNPDFYLISPHGAGRNSFLYYLPWLGTPASNASGLRMCGKTILVSFPTPKTETRQALGLQVDHYFYGKPLCYGKANQKVIQLTRDPVELLAHHINYGIHSIATCGWDDTANLKSLMVIPKDLLEDYGRMNVLMFTSMHGRVITSSQDTLWIDSTDLSAKICPTTMRRVATFLGVPYNEKLDHLCCVAYNSVQNRLWAYQPGKWLTVMGGEWRPGHFGDYVTDIKAFPSFLHDFHANHHWRAHVLDVFEHSDQEYTVSMPEWVFSHLPDSVQHRAWGSVARAAMIKAIDIRLAQHEFFMTLYRKYAVTPDDVIAMIRSDPAFHSRFMKIMEHEISLPAKEAPHIVERWKNFHRL